MDQRLQQARRIDDISTVLVDAGIRAVKRNPIPVGAYILGILICLCFSGFKPSVPALEHFEEKMNNVDYSSLEKITIDLDYAQHEYRRSKGWFSCDTYCQRNKNHLDSVQKEYNMIKSKFDKDISDAKAGLGIFSDSGVSETRDLFWLRFSQGKGFATRQSKWDALFMGIGAMSRDEGMLSYIMRLVMSVVFNFTLGMIGAVVGFIVSLPSMLYAYQVPLFYGFVFFFMASLAAMAFAATWLLGLYAATAGAVYVGAKIAASNMRLEGGGGGGGGYQRVNYTQERYRQR